MRTFWFSGLLALAACTGGDIDYNDDTAGDGGVESPTGTFVGPQVEFLGGLEDCTSVLTNEDGKVYKAEAGETIELVEGTYTVTFGDTDLATEASDGLPIHVSPTGWTTIAPPVTVTIEEGVEQMLLPPTMNAYVDGTWTCNVVGGDETTAQTGSVYYINGDQIHFPTGSINVDGTTLWYEDEDCANGGSLLNAQQAIVTINCPAVEYYLETECWRGTYAQRPATW